MRCHQCSTTAAYEAHSGIVWSVPRGVPTRDFYLAWTFVWVYGVYPWANRTIGDETLVYALINIVFRFAIWVLPVFGDLRYVDRVDVL